MTDVPAGQPAATQPITEDVTCAHCGYNLRGLTLDTRCPECGTPIAQSVHGNLLRYADPDWLDKLRFGAALMLWNLLIGICLAVVGAVVSAAGLPPVFMGLLSLVAGALGLWAMFLITTPEPALALTEDPVTLRKVVRTCAIVSFVGGALQQAGTTRSGGMITTLSLQQPGTVSAADVVIVVAGGVLLLVGIVSHFGFFVFLRRFALRIPDEKLASHTKTVMWGFVGASAALTIAGVVAALTVGATMRAAAAGASRPVATGAMPWPGGGAGAVSALALGVLGCGGGLAAAVFGIWYIVLLFRYHAAFREATMFSRQALAAAGTVPTCPGAPPRSPLPPD